jgi:hypothetical protein
MFNPLLYIIQTDKSALMNKIDIPLLEIFYNTFTCFDPQVLYSSNNHSLKNTALTVRALQRPLPTRHSRFHPCFEITAQSGVKKVVHKFGTDLTTLDKAHEKQKKMPQRMTEYRKVIKL